MEKFLCLNCGKEFETTLGSNKRYAGLCHSCRKLGLTHSCSVCGLECSIYNRTCGKECMLKDPIRKKNQREANKNYWDNVSEDVLEFKRSVSKRSWQRPDVRKRAVESLRDRWSKADDEYRAKHGRKVSEAVLSNPNLAKTLQKSILGGKVSMGQRQVFDFVKKLCPDAVLEYPLERFQFDIFIPSKNLAIEFNGYYWHCDRAYGHENTLRKFNLCKEKEIRYILIWEFDWQQKRLIIENKLRSLLGYSKERIYARDCDVREDFSLRIKSDFLDLKHLQGNDRAFYWIGLFKDDACVSIMTFRKSRDNKAIELSRFCGDVVGGFTRLLKHACTKLKLDGVSELISFSDNSISDGGLYNNNGWEFMSDVNSDYRVVYNGECYHKSSFTRANIKKRFPLVYSDNLTEFQMEDLIPAYRIWDCGKKKWKFNISTLSE